MKPSYFVLFLLVILPVISVAVPVIDDLKQMEDIHPQRLLRPDEQNVRLLGVEYAIGKSFNVPVNFESHPQLARGSAEQGLSTVNFSISQSQTLKDALDQIIELNQGLLEYSLIHGQICVLPVKKTEDTILSNLDVRVSIRTVDASLWDSLKAIVTAVNHQKATEHPLGIYPIEWEGMRKVPPEFTEKREITLNLQNVTARQAICAAFSASSLQVFYRYCAGKNDSLSIVTCEDGWQRQSEENMARDEFEFWKRETGWNRGKWTAPGLE